MKGIFNVYCIVINNFIYIKYTSLHPKKITFAPSVSIYLAFHKRWMVRLTDIDSYKVTLQLKKAKSKKKKTDHCGLAYLPDKLIISCVTKYIFTYSVDENTGQNKIKHVEQGSSSNP